MRDLWKRFKAWVDREAELIAQDTWAPCTADDPAVQSTLAKLDEAKERMRFENVPLLLHAGRKRWRQPVKFQPKPTIYILPTRERK